VIVLVIALLFLGSKRIPEGASGLGKGIRKFRRTRSLNATQLFEVQSHGARQDGRHAILRRV
jgi:TatA/E family protein of Tat protein translocase